MADWHWESVTDDLLDTLPPAAMAAVRQVADELAILRAIPPLLANRDFQNFYSNSVTWDGWGSNPRPADYEKPGLTLWARCLHGYHRSKRT